MADGNGNGQQPHVSLSIGDVDRITDIAFKAKAIIATLRCASSQFAGPQHALEGACWAAEDFIGEMVRIATGEGNANG